MGENIVPLGMGSRILVLIVFLHLCSNLYCSGSSEIESKMYRHTLDNGDKITCFMCEPGFKFKSHCTTDGGQASCEPCEDGKFNSRYTVARDCAYCSTECQTPKREYIAKNCTPVSNISCLCREGFYRDPVQFGLCLTINPCPPGQGVVEEGYGLADTLCEDCPVGYFSANTSKTEPCQECSRCLQGTVQDEDCRPHADRTCKSPDADGFPVEAVIGILIAVVVVVIVILLVCCFCVMRERCARLRKQLCKCCHRPYEECTQLEKPMKNGSTHLDDITVNIPNGTNVPDLIRNTHELAPSVPDSVFYRLREDLISQEYPQFFRFLFTNDADTHINEMKLNYNHHGVKEIIYQILVRWRDIEKENAKPENILTALHDWGRKDLVQKYSDIFGQDTSQMDNMKEHRNGSKSSVSTDV